MKKIYTLLLAWILMALPAVSYAQIELYQPPLLPPRVTVPVEPEEAAPKAKLITSDFSPGVRTWVPCLPTINGVDGTAQGFLLESTYIVSAKKIERLIEAVCISLSAELALHNFKPDTREELRKLPVILAPNAETDGLNAYYESKLDVMVIADGFLSPTIPVSALIFTLSHEIAHRQNYTLLKSKGIRVGGAAAIVAGAVMGLNPFKKAALAKKGVKAVGAALAVGGGVAMICPNKFWDNEISADRYAASALFAFYHKTQPTSVAQQTVLAAAQSLMRISPSERDEDCLNLEKKAPGDETSRVNFNPHPGPATRMKYIRKELNLH